MNASCAAHLTVMLGQPYRAHRLMNRGQIDEAERVVVALRRERGAMDHWNGKARP